MVSPEGRISAPIISRPERIAQVRVAGTRRPARLVSSGIAVTLEFWRAERRQREGVPARSMALTVQRLATDAPSNGHNPFTRKNFKVNSVMKNLFAYVLACLLVAGVAVADEHAKLINGTADPSAEGSVDYHHDRNGNTSMELKVDHLAPPSNLQPSKQVYVVWVQAPGKAPENKGMLKTNENQQGSVKMISPYPAFDVFVTAEDNPSVAAPTGPEVLHGTVQNK